MNQNQFRRVECFAFFVRLALALTIALTLLCWANGGCQEPYRPRYGAFIQSGLSGASWGIREKLNHNPDVVLRFVKPGLTNWFDPRTSWRNKYWQRNPDNGRNNIPVWVTDAHHFLGTTTQVLCFSAGITISYGKRQKWWHYALDAGLCFASYTVGNYLTYDVIFK